MDSKTRGPLVKIFKEKPYIQRRSYPLADKNGRPAEITLFVTRDPRRELDSYMLYGTSGRTLLVVYTEKISPGYNRAIRRQ